MKLGDVVTINSTTVKKNYPFETICYFDISSVGEGFIREIEEIDLETAPSRARRIIKNGDTIISTVRPGNRTFYFCKNVRDNSIASTGFAVLTPFKNLINERYLYYLISQREFTSYLVNHQKGSTYPAITVDVIKNKNIDLPNLDVQKKIARILSAYDDLIENNFKRIKLLEKAAQNIYKEWFVNMRFPDYENTPINQETGLPYNWKKEKIGNILKLIHGFAFKAKDFVNEPTNIMVIRMGNFNEYGDLQLDKNVKYLPSGTEIKERYKLFAGDLLMVLSDVTRDGRIIGNVGILPQKEITYALNQRVANLKLQEPKLKYYFLYSLNSYHFKEYCKSRANGATVLNLKTTDVLNYEITIPSKKLIDLFLNQVTPLNQLKENLFSSIDKLKSARDILLPRLMNQTIEV